MVEVQLGFPKEIFDARSSGADVLVPAESSQFDPHFWLERRRILFGRIHSFPLLAGVPERFRGFSISSGSFLIRHQFHRGANSHGRAFSRLVDFRS